MSSGFRSAKAERYDSLRKRPLEPMGAPQVRGMRSRELSARHSSPLAGD
jgi:hypothetical protein